MLRDALEAPELLMGLERPNEMTCRRVMMLVAGTAVSGALVLLGEADESVEESEEMLDGAVWVARS